MEKFERCNRDTEDTLNSKSIKIPRRDIPTGLQTRKAAFEKFKNKGYAAFSAGPSTLHKPIQPKPPPAVKPSSDDKTEKDPNPPHLNPVAQRFGVQLQPTNRGNDGKTGCTKSSIKTSDLSKEDPKPLNPKPAWNKFLTPPDKEKHPLEPKPNFNFASQENEGKTEFSKVVAVKEKLRSATQENEPKPPVSKPPLAQKPSLNNEVSQNEDTSNKSGFLQRQSGLRTNIHALQEAKEMGENSNSAAEGAGSHFPKIALKPTGHRLSLSKGTPKAVAENTEEKGMSATKNIFLNKITQEGSGSSSKFYKMNTAFAAGRPSGEPQEKENGDRSSVPIPKQKLLPPVFELGQPPEKPSRPPTMHLGKFQKCCQEKNPKNEGLEQKAPSSAALAPPAPPSHSTVQFPPPPPASHPSLPAAPSLPPRNIKPNSETTNLDNEENYDDVEFVSQGHGNTQKGQESDGETYEDINDIRSPMRKKQKQDEDKRRMDQEKKEQKEKEKKEHELRKKFKLTGPIEVLHQARARVDHKGRKGELTVKQGDKIEIIRLTDNPEGKWLGRIKECYGYIKTTMVEIDYDSLKRKQKPSTRAAVKHTESDQETYDDVGEQDTTSSQSGDQGGSGNMIQPPPSDQDIYDEIDEEDATPSMSSSTKQSGKDYGDNVYDDVDSSDFPPPPPELSSSKSGSFGKPKSDEKDMQKLKKMEKEEKEFRKKFKFDGEIKVLYSTTTVQELSQKRWGYKDLQIKPGESLDIIESTDDTKVLCRNQEGKYGYVLRSNLVQNDGEIYDDVGDDCIYDNGSDAEFS
ncbi:FYN-binding protein 1 isoform X2 [Prinia subflava]|uniref:FYN-binding protein 1 isoform X2 n=1 Tax=Prinia subflava TaxID=208062 RepID=UPI002FE1E9B7